MKRPKHDFVKYHSCPIIPIFYNPIRNQPHGQSGNLLYQAVMPGPVATEKLSSFVFKLHQPIAQQQKSCLKDTTHFINFLGKTKVRENTILVSMDIMSLYTNLQEERLNIVCNGYTEFYRNERPINKCLLQRALKLILVENSILWRKRPTNTWVKSARLETIH